MKNIVIFGAGGHAKVIADVLEKQNTYKVIGFLDDNIETGTRVYGYEVLGDKEYLVGNIADIYGCIVALGDNWIRNKVVSTIKNLNLDLKFISAVHPSATLGKGVIVGDGTAVMAGSSINSDTIIGEHCIINTQSSIDHDVNIGSYSTIAPNATIGGGSKIGDLSTISISATVIHGVKVDSHTIVGAGSVVLNDLPSHSIVYGVPAKVVRSRVENERYL